MPAANAQTPGAAVLQLGLFQKDGEAWWAWQAVARRQPDLVTGLVPSVSLLDPGNPAKGVALRATAEPGLDVKSLCRRMVGFGFGCLVVDQAPVPAAKPATTMTAAGAGAGDPPPDGIFTYSEEDQRVLAEIEKRARRPGRLGTVVPDTIFDVNPAVMKRENWNLCALTFDDGPHRTVTRQILDVLNEERVRATYFPVAKIALNYPDLIREFVGSGHEVGNHSLTHADLRSLPPEAQRIEVAESTRILRSMGATTTLFRPPYGRYNQELLSIIRAEGMSPVLWNVDTRDWKVRDPDKIVQHVETVAGAGSVLLLHSTYPSTATALPRVITSMRAKGCKFVTMTEWLDGMRALAAPMMVNADGSVPTPASKPLID